MHPSLEVHKFGGTSVGDAGRIRAVARILAEARARAGVVAVSSAVAGTTDRLVDITSSRDARVGSLASIREQHESLTRELQLDGGPVGDRVAALLDELDALAGALDFLQETPPAIHDRIHSTGERLAVELLAGVLEAQGVPARACPADAFLDTSADFGEADPATFRTDRRTASALRTVLDDGVVPIVTGFFGRGPDGDVRLLGRGGSDLSASLVASALDADRLVIWTDVPGVYTCDPRLVPEARRIERLHYREAGEMAYFGSKVLHPRTMIPAVRKDIPIEVRSSLDPEAPGTVISAVARDLSEHDVSVSVVRDVTLVSLEGAGMAGVAGISARLFDALAAAGVSVILISQSSSEASITFAVRTPDAARAINAVRAAFRLDLARALVQEISSRPDLAVITTVGAALSHRVGAAASIMAAAARAGVNLLAITQGSSELSVSIVVDEEDARRAARAIHQAVTWRDPGHAPAALACAIVGLGTVGAALVDTIGAPVVAIADSSGYVLADRPCTRGTEEFDRAFGSALARRRGGGRIADVDGAVAGGTARDLVDEILRAGIPAPVMIDCTADAGMVDVARHALAAGIDVVAANKHVLASDVDVASDARAGGALVLGEATVGAGLPVASTIDHLVEAGDEILRIDAALSGTMAFVIERLVAGESLRVAVENAIALGFAEPDPTADLEGQDLMRKAVILGRLARFASCAPGTSAPVPVPLVDLSGEGELGARLDAAHAKVHGWVRAAIDDGRSPRYLAHLDAAGAVVIEPTAVDARHPFFGIPADRAAVALWTRRQGEHPLVISGSGAGAMPTVGGILMDLARLAALRTVTPTGGIR